MVMAIVVVNKEWPFNKQLMMNNTKKKAKLKSNTTNNESIQKIIILDGNSGSDSSMDRQYSRNNHEKLGTMPTRKHSKLASRASSVTRR